ncbi:MAG: hypothetical protein KJO11_00695, partial [Gemmatimonadetes bacterium]|nr:hypothetical protein [Gemmatimonadota bacterium]
RKNGGEVAGGWVRQSANGMLRWAVTGGVGLDTRNHRWARLSLDASVRRPLAEGWEWEGAVFAGAVAARDPAQLEDGWDGAFAPAERRFFLSSADPWASTPIPWLRSAGAALDAEGWTSGGGTLRGYDPRLPFPWVATASGTVRAPEFAVGGVAARPLVAVGLGVAGAAAPPVDLPAGELLASFGAGVELGMPGSGWRLRLDVPFWVNRPALASGARSDEVGFRIQVGFVN